MKPNIKVDTSGFDKSVMSASLTKQDMLDIEKPGALVLRNGMVMRVQKKTSATANSTNQHIIKASSLLVVDDVGPETVYAPNIEFGRRDMPNYPVQPYVRPTVREDRGTVLKVITHAFKRKVEEKWQR